MIITTINDINIKRNLIDQTTNNVFTLFSNDRLSFVGILHKSYKIFIKLLENCFKNYCG